MAVNYRGKKFYNIGPWRQANSNGMPPIDIESLQNRLLKVCYVLATSASRNRLLFFLFAAAINSANEANEAGGMLR